MDLVTNLPAFLVALVIISATPGPAMALIIRRTAIRGRRYGIATIIGLELGLYVWALLVASGVAVVALSEIGYLILKIVGCIVLAWLAYRSFRGWWRLRREDVTPPEPVERATLRPTQEDPSTGSGRGQSGRFTMRGGLVAVGEGFAVQLANPKAAVFLLALYPQFVPADRPLFQTTALLGILQVAVETMIYLTIALAVHRAGGWFRRSVVRRRLEAVTGTVLVTLGIRLATTHR